MRGVKGHLAGGLSVAGGREEGDAGALEAAAEAALPQRGDRRREEAAMGGERERARRAGGRFKQLGRRHFCAAAGELADLIFSRPATTQFSSAFHAEGGDSRLSSLDERRRSRSKMTSEGVNPSSMFRKSGGEEFCHKSLRNLREKAMPS
jgi:hypothetical protein